MRGTNVSDYDYVVKSVVSGAKSVYPSMRRHHDPFGAAERELMTALGEYPLV
jgi:hypothetical protein